jgi:hypothetical protein
MTTSQIHHTGIVESIKSKFGLVRFLTGLCAGSLTFIVSVGGVIHFGIFRLKFACSLFALCVLLGALLSLQEHQVFSRMAKAAWKIQMEDRKDSTILLDDALSKKESLLFVLFYLSFAASITSMVAAMWLI